MHESIDHGVVLAPLSGLRLALSRVPDPVFAQGMVGVGVAIDPTSDTVLAPIDGEVVQLHAAQHALTLRSPLGIEVLVHVGIDSVQLRGEGFTALVAVGQAVRAGQPLLRVDLDEVAQRARSLISVVLVLPHPRLRGIEPGRGPLQAGRSLLFRLVLADAEDAGVAPVSDLAQTLCSGPVRLPNPAGLHARPAAVLAARARDFHAELHLRLGERRANAKSVVGIMSLGSRLGDAVVVEAVGPDAAPALQALGALLAEGCGEDITAAAAGLAASPAAAAMPAAVTAADPGQGLRGVCASPGIAVGRVHRWRRATVKVDPHSAGAGVERQRLQQALHAARNQLARLQASGHDDARAGILAAHLGLLDDPDLFDSALAGIARGGSAGSAWQQAYHSAAAALAALDDPLLRERAADLEDIGERVLRCLGGHAAAPPALPADCILLAEDLSPSETAQLDRERVRGFATLGGGPTGHVAILARSLGIPALCALDAAALALEDGREVLLDADAGLLDAAPSVERLAQARAAQARARDALDEARRHAKETARTRDGVRIEVVANVRHAADAREAVANGAEGVGLLRSEFLFEERNHAPDEDEQAAAYAEVAAVLGERPLVIRTLDVGGDKPLPYLPLAQEDNPFLGLRGIRVSLRHEALFRTQLRALLRGAGAAKLQVMLPMVATIEELRAARALLVDEAAALGVAAPPLGVMIEVPSAALIADALAREAEFFSIGSNDLTQYTLAMDRGHAQLAGAADALHPAVLRLIGMAGEAAARHGRWMGVCGAIAADPLAVPALLGLGVTELSIPAPSVAQVKAAVARCTLADCRALAAELLALGTAAEVRARLAAVEVERGR
jgi:multiphosphoryl transfer protein